MPASGSSMGSAGQIVTPPTASTSAANPPNPISAYRSMRSPVASSTVRVSSGAPPIEYAALILSLP